MNGHSDDRISKYGQNLKGKVALVTGSSRGIGAACAIRLAEHGADIVINYVQAQKQAEQVAEKCRALGVRAIVTYADVTSSSDVENMFKKTMEEFGQIDIVYSNSGKEHWGKAGEVPEHEFDEIFHVNVRSQWFVSQMAAKYMSEYGRLILISSISAQKGVPAHSLYAATKAAIQGMARCLAVDLGTKGITVNVVAPGGIKTDMYTHAAAKYIPGGDKMSEKDLDDALARWSPLNRVGFPDDVAGTVAILASEEAQWLTGQVLHCSGGAHMAGS